ncbi:MAG: hypothetical protein AAF236_01145 [Verrucomicrobiota bacterium]
MLKQFFVRNWRGKLTSLLIACAIWYLIRNHLGREADPFPVPGTTTPAGDRNDPPSLDEALIETLTAPVPGGDANP